MFTLEEKIYLLKVLKRAKRWRLFRKLPRQHERLIEKLEQLIRNEQVNQNEL